MKNETEAFLNRKGDAPSTNRPVVCIQGVGFVGAAMAIAIANARDDDNEPYYDVVGVDLDTREGRKRIECLNEGRFPFTTSDKQLTDALEKAIEQGNLRAVADERMYRRASIVVVDVQLDLTNDSTDPDVDFHSFKSAIRTLGNHVKPGALVIVETTVPPGTCEQIVAPLLNECLEKRGLGKERILIAHSYERVMPGANYYDSIVNFWRVYSGLTPDAADACESFLSKIINTEQFPLTRLHSTTASETAKVMENSYRAVNIAFIEEWARFAETAGVDLFQVIETIRMRPTHNNIRQPGFGVGGYCLTKDPLFARISSTKLYDYGHLNFPFCEQAVRLNRRMPLVTLSKLEALLGGSLRDKSVLLLGVSYRQDVGDTRSSPSQIFYEQAIARGADVTCHDPLVDYWPELDMEISREMPPAGKFHGIVFAVPHHPYTRIDLHEWLAGSDARVVDANNVLTDSQRDMLSRDGVVFASIGRGTT